MRLNLALLAKSKNKTYKNLFSTHEHAISANERINLISTQHWVIWLQCDSFPPKIQRSDQNRLRIQTNLFIGIVRC
jgi:hypothetical protein